MGFSCNLRWAENNSRSWSLIVACAIQNGLTFTACTGPASRKRQAPSSGLPAASVPPATAIMWNLTATPGTASV